MTARNTVLADLNYDYERHLKGPSARTYLQLPLVMYSAINHVDTGKIIRSRMIPSLLPAHVQSLHHDNAQKCGYDTVTYADAQKAVQEGALLQDAGVREGVPSNQHPVGRYPHSVETLDTSKSLFTVDYPSDKNRQEYPILEST